MSTERKTEDTPTQIAGIVLGAVGGLSMFPSSLFALSLPDLVICIGSVIFLFQRSHKRRIEEEIDDRTAPPNQRITPVVLVEDETYVNRENL